MHKVFKTKRTFKKEFKRQIRMAFTAAVGFTIAFAWRNAIFDAMENFTSRALDITPDHYLTETYTAVAITTAGVLLLFATTKILRD